MLHGILCSTLHSILHGVEHVITPFSLNCTSKHSSLQQVQNHKLRCVVCPILHSIICCTFFSQSELQRELTKCNRTTMTFAKSIMINRSKALIHAIQKIAREYTCSPRMYRIFEKRNNGLSECRLEPTKGDRVSKFSVPQG